MASLSTLCTLSFLLLLPLTPLFTHAQPHINITAILDNATQFTVFIRLLKQTELATQINSELNTSTQGLTVFAPTDNAFSNLPAGTLNKLSNKQQLQLLQYHILEKFYRHESLVIVSNPVRTRASGQDGHQFLLNFIGKSDQVNVSTGVVDVQLYNALRKDPPLAVYQVDKVLWPVEFSMSNAPAASPPSSAVKADGGADDSGVQVPETKPNCSGKMSSWLGFISGVFLICMGLLF